MPGPSVHFEHAEPIFRVDNMDAALHFYVDKLGFRNAEWGNAEFTCISRGGADIYLSRGDQGAGKAWAWVGVSDARQLHEEFLAAGVAIRMTPTRFDWAVEMQVEDPDGNVLRFGSEAT